MSWSLILAAGGIFVIGWWLIALRNRAARRVTDPMARVYLLARHIPDAPSTVIEWIALSQVSQNGVLAGAVKALLLSYDGHRGEERREQAFARSLMAVGDLPEEVVEYLSMAAKSELQSLAEFLDRF